MELILNATDNAHEGVLALPQGENLKHLHRNSRARQ